MYLGMFDWIVLEPFLKRFKKIDCVSFESLCRGGSIGWVRSVRNARRKLGSLLVARPAAIRTAISLSARTAREKC
jgi:hypothetical protein